ncbi:MAG: hypothetical protein HC915_05450 [Anaerolineae bacterium]|nr:hypothetical protein [Anaerolineae bacterium]
MTTLKGPWRASITVLGVVVLGLVLALSLARREAPRSVMLAYSLQGYSQGRTLHRVLINGQADRALMTGNLSVFYVLRWHPSGEQLAYAHANENLNAWQLYPDILTEQAAPHWRVELAFRSLAPLSWSPDLREVALLDTETRLVRLHPTTGRSLLYQSQGLLNHPTWSPDGQWIAFTEGDNVRALPLEGGPVRRLTDQGAGAGLFNQPLSWSPDSQQLATVSRWGDGFRPYVVDLRAGTVRPLAAVEQVREQLNWSPDGAWVVFTTEEGRLYRVRVADGLLQDLTPHRQRVLEADWSPDGTQLAYVVDEGRHVDLYLMEADGGQPRRLIRSPDFRIVQQPRWAPVIDLPWRGGGLALVGLGLLLLARSEGWVRAFRRRFGR